MYDDFKKYIIKYERNLLPILNKAKRIQINDKHLEIEDKIVFKENLQLPYDVTCFEFKRYILLVIDRFQNQKGYWQTRRLIIFAKVKARMNEVFNFIHSTKKELLKCDIYYTKIPLTGATLLWNLMGLMSVPNDKFNLSKHVFTEEQNKIINHCALNDPYIKWELEINMEDTDLIFDSIFYLTSKKDFMKINLPEYSEEYKRDFMVPFCFLIFVNMCKGIIYLESKRGKTNV